MLIDEYMVIGPASEAEFGCIDISINLTKSDIKDRFNYVFAPKFRHFCTLTISRLKQTISRLIVNVQYVSILRLIRPTLMYWNLKSESKRENGNFNLLNSQQLFDQSGQPSL